MGSCQLRMHFQPTQTSCGLREISNLRVTLGVDFCRRGACVDVQRAGWVKRFLVFSLALAGMGVMLTVTCHRCCSLGLAGRVGVWPLAC